ncbi:hypothetical protein ACFX5F_13955 [Flavobacterium sp. ZS1P70]|uniref:Uncharacterized protein n=1 Tax=Flavobacterium zhoui TaxID=3230414 RepID=A0ABW6I7R9_9FLAO
MKIKLTTAIFFFAIAFVSCKNEDKKATAVPVEEVKANTFDVIVDLVIKKDDELILFYKDSSINYFDEKNTVYYGLKGKQEPQTITFSIPEGVLPNDIRFDISSKKDQSPIKINSIRLSFEGRTFRVDQKDLLKYFTPNEFITFDESSATATLISKGEKYDPIFNTKQAIYIELEKVRGVKL